MDLQNKVALVTGAGARIGRVLALALAERSVRVIVHYYTSSAGADAVVAQIKEKGGDALAVQADLRDIANLPHLIERGVETFGQVDILINSAAIFQHGTIYDTNEANWDAHLNINLKAPFFLCQAYAQHLSEDQSGHIINIADWRAMRPGTAHTAYFIAKAGLVAMTRSLALALAPNVQVNAIAPGGILPPPGGDGYSARLAQRIPAKRVGSPEEIAKAVLYLLDSDFVTGEVLYVTGGEHL